MLEEFKVQNAPAAMQELVQKHNALVELIGMMRGVNGIYTHVSRGGIVLSANPTGLSGTGQQLGSGSGTGGNVGGTIQTVGTNGALFDVLQPESPNAPGGYPTLLRVGNNSSQRGEITSNGFYALSGTNYVSASTLPVDAGFAVGMSGLGFSYLTPNACVISNGAYAASLRAAANEGLYIQKSGGGTYLYIQENEITRIMGVKTISVCDNGNSRSMLIIASDPF